VAERDTRRAIADLQAAAASCTDCELFEHATQTVFGEGPADAELMLVGEQPGDREDREGRPFVGPAGRVLDDALRASGLDRGRIYVTNAVKHFKWVPRGKVRLHKQPGAREVAACRQWWVRELEAIRPTGVVCLGAVAAAALVGRDVRVGRDRGTYFDHALADWATVTAHPSSILRAPDRDARFAELVDDLVGVRRLLESTRE
jgi:DNA polymerase